jgi:hypothetical protein
MSDNDVVIAEKHLFDDKTHDALTVHDVKCIGTAA